jgi:hypothetical protein
MDSRLNKLFQEQEHSEQGLRRFSTQEWKCQSSELMGMREYPQSSH